MRSFAGGILATLVVLTVGGWLYIKLGYVDLRATPEPSRLESDLTGTALDAFAARKARVITCCGACIPSVGWNRWS